MTTVDAPGARTPWWFWLVAAISLLWNGFGAFDYTMSHVAPDSYMTAAQKALLATYPGWMHGVWAVGVWGSALGAVLLLLRSKWAFHAFAVSILGALGSFAYSAARGLDPIFPAVICAICAGFIWFARTMTKRGVLR
ncbi:MAG: hypothetical protein JNL41_02890 [Phenylobacterium sp.]|uniref:hypothetical protein n=1 Tax=Phenylobacterium sp. TaxID=1871053 RepID=UPI001A579725|nr:hypothetical protein [Phenylobacterium sp.]MBL8553199.1 hypothetical protein [Phenylobacterium sp.]